MTHPTTVYESETEKAEQLGPRVVVQRHINPLSKAARSIHGFTTVTQEE